MKLNLDQDFKPFNGIEIQFESFTFNGGEPHIKIDPNFDRTQEVLISLRINSFQDLGFLCMAVDALRSLNVKRINLFIPYFPAARQDRVMIPGEPLSVKVYSTIINGLQLNKVTIFDPHSEVVAALLENVEVSNNNRFIETALKLIKEDVLLISPDGGALKKIYQLSSYLGGIKVIECSKSRDVKSGKLSGFKVYSDDLKGKSCLIVDDICDGGGTFIGLAKELKAKNAGNLYLAISHGIFSQGLENLKAHFTQIFTTNSIKNINELGVTQINLNHGLLS